MKQTLTTGFPPAPLMLLVASVSMLTAGASSAPAQVHYHYYEHGDRSTYDHLWHHEDFSWSTWDPHWAVSAQIRAQAALVRAQGAAAVDFAAARNLHAEAYAKELDNWMAHLRTHWNRKILKEQKRIELEHVRQIRKMRYLNDEKWKNSRLWDALKNHPRLARGRIRTGEALNFLLERLAVTALPYEYDPLRSRFSQEALDSLRLDAKILGQIRLKHGAFVFAADQTVTEEIDLWPYVLRWKEFEAARTAFADARRTVVQESRGGKTASVASIRRMQDALYELTNDFYASEKVKEWVRRYRRYLQFSNAEKFLRRLDREVSAVEQSGGIHPLLAGRGYDPNREGHNLVQFLSFLNRNGIEFAPAQPGRDEAYHHLFVMMRSLYLTVAEWDESTQPKDFRRIAK